MELKNWLFLNGFKQIEVAVKAGINPSILNKALNGRQALPDHHVHQLAVVLGLSDDEVRLGRVKGGRK